MIVKLKDVVNRVNNNIDRFTTDIQYYLGKGHGECGELAISEHGDLKKDVGTLGFKFHFGFKPGDTLFFSRSFALRKAGMATYEGICSDSTYILRSKDEAKLLSKYLPIVLQSDVFWEYCDTHHTGGVNFLINWSTLADYEFDLPCLEEQQRISDRIWSAYNLKESYKKLLIATDELVKSQFIEMFEEDKYPRISLDAIADEWLKGQAFKKDEICENGDKHCIHYGELFTKYGPVIKEVVSKTSVDLKKPSKNGDILFPASDVTPNGLARCSMLPYDNVVLGGDIIVLRPKEGYSPAYLSYAINQQTTQLLARVNGGLVKHLSAKGLKTVEIPIPSKEKQEEYIRIAEQADKSKYIN